MSYLDKKLMVDILKKGQEHWTIEESIDSLIEEMGELITKLQQSKRNRVTTDGITEEMARVTADEITEEMADVQIMLAVLVGRNVFCGTEHYTKMIMKKFRKMNELIDAGVK